MAGSDHLESPLLRVGPEAHSPKTPTRTSALKIHTDGTYSYSYGPPGVAGLLQNRYALLCAIFASIGGLSFGYDQGVVGFFIQ